MGIHWHQKYLRLGKKKKKQQNNQKIIYVLFYILYLVCDPPLLLHLHLIYIYTTVNPAIGIQAKMELNWEFTRIFITMGVCPVCQTHCREHGALEKRKGFFPIHYSKYSVPLILNLLFIHIVDNHMPEPHEGKQNIAYLHRNPMVFLL
jgi:hypothetical protein